MLIDIIIGNTPDLKLIKALISEINKTHDISYRLITTGEICTKTNQKQFFQKEGLPQPVINFGAQNQNAETKQIIETQYKYILNVAPCTICLCTTSDTSAKHCIEIAKNKDIKGEIIDCNARMAELINKQQGALV
jgi:UDP-N-acetylglucosamine 2-epimerase